MVRADRRPRRPWCRRAPGPRQGRGGEADVAASAREGGGHGTAPGRPRNFSPRRTCGRPWRGTAPRPPVGDNVARGRGCTAAAAENGRGGRRPPWTRPQRMSDGDDADDDPARWAGRGRGIGSYCTNANHSVCYYSIYQLPSNPGRNHDAVLRRPPPDAVEDQRGVRQATWQACLFLVHTRSRGGDVVRVFDREGRVRRDARGWGRARRSPRSPNESSRSRRRGTRETSPRLPRSSRSSRERDVPE